MTAGMRMPAMFFGHGSPMNTLEDNVHTRAWAAAGRASPRPRAILAISAHWYVRGTAVTAMDKPPTIHDFGGFPQELYEVQYPAPGNPELAAEMQGLLTKTTLGLDHEWGLDHGTWTIIRHMYPEADIPVLQLSIDYNKPATWHYELARDLATLRRKGVLIVGSGIAATVLRARTGQETPQQER